MKAETLRRIQDVFRRVFNSPHLVITAATTARDLEDWDSLRHVDLVLALEEEFGVRLRAAVLDRMSNVGEMAEHLEGLS